MSAFSANRPENQRENRRRILSLWLPRLPIDRIKRKFTLTISSERREAISHDIDSRLPPPLWGRAGERGKPQAPSSSPPPPLALPHKGGGNDTFNGAPSASPHVVIAKQSNALVIYALDDLAARSGLSIGLPLANARAICPELTVFDADEAADRKTLDDIADWCDRFTPLVALDPPHGLFLDITGCAHLFGGEAALLQTVTDALTRRGFTVSAAIASTSVCARTLTRHVSGKIIADGEEAKAVAPLPVTALGANEAIAGGLRRAGLKTIGDVASRARHEIAARFGAAFTAHLEHALGEGDAPISPRKPLPDYIVEKRFPEPVATETVIAMNLSALAAMLIAAMDKQGKGARRLEASFFRTDGAVRTIAVDTGRPVTKREVIDRLFRERLEALNDPLDPGFGFDLIRLSASRTEIMVQQQRDLDTSVHDNDELAALIDRIAARIGGKRVVVHLPQDTHIPERAVLAMPAQHNLAVAVQADWPERVASEPPLRPLRLFDRPEPIKVPFATVPDGPPHQFTWRRVTHTVARVEGPERIAMEWWRQNGATLTRDYFRIEDQAGLRFWIFRDGLYESELKDEKGKPVEAKWFVHGLFA
jgi:protein ImuB